MSLRAKGRKISGTGRNFLTQGESCCHRMKFALTAFFCDRKTTTKATTTITTTVPQQKQWKNLNGMTDPPSKMHLRGAVPPSKMHLGGNLTFYHLFS